MKTAELLAGGAELDEGGAPVELTVVVEPDKVEVGVTVDSVPEVKMKVEDPLVVEVLKDNVGVGALLVSLVDGTTELPVSAGGGP